MISEIQLLVLQILFSTSYYNDKKKFNIMIIPSLGGILLASVAFTKITPVRVTTKASSTSGRLSSRICTGTVADTLLSGISMYPWTAVKSSVGLAATSSSDNGVTDPDEMEQDTRTVPIEKKIYFYLQYTGKDFECFFWCQSYNMNNRISYFSLGDFI